MISEVRKFTEKNHITKSEYIPPLLTWGIITFILFFALYTRIIVSSNEGEESVEAFSDHVVASGEQQLSINQEVDWVLNPILNLYYLQDNDCDYNLLANVKKNISTKQMILEQNKLQLLQSKSSVLRELIGSEKESDFHGMSLEGRKLIIYIIREIFNIYDYKFNINTYGEIVEIVDQSGSVVYSMPTINTGTIYYNGLIIVLSVLLIALILCVLIAKKKHLFVKEVRYDGFNTKRYA